MLKNKQNPQAIFDYSMSKVVGDLSPICIIKKPVKEQVSC